MRPENGQVIRRAKGRRARGIPHEPSAAGRKFCEVDDEEVNSTTQKRPARSATKRRQRTSSEIPVASSAASSGRAASSRRDAMPSAPPARRQRADSIRHLVVENRDLPIPDPATGARRAGGLDCQIYAEAFFSSGKGHGKNPGTRRPRTGRGEAPLVLRFFPWYFVPEEKACEVLPTARYYGPPLKTRGLPFRALPDLPTPSHQLSN